MGGQAFSQATRIPKKKYEKISREILEFFSSKGYQEMCLTRSYRNKNTFGDIDILYCRISGDDFRDHLREFGIEDENIKKHSNCFSVLYKNAQIDFLGFSLEDFETAKMFYSFNDLFNIIGKQSRVLQCKLGFDGLKFVYYYENNRKEIFPLSKDPQFILSFLGFNYEEFQRGFTTLEDVFEYAIDGKYFHPDLYFNKVLDNSDTKHRDAKRKNYELFIKFLGWKDLPKSEPFIKRTQEENLRYLYTIFPSLKFRVQEFERKLKRKKDISSKFNGKIVMEKFGYSQGKQLGIDFGKFIRRIDSLYGNYEDFILNSSFEKIEEEWFQATKLD